MGGCSHDVANVCKKPVVRMYVCVWLLDVCGVAVTTARAENGVCWVFGTYLVGVTRSCTKWQRSAVVYEVAEK